MSKIPKTIHYVWFGNNEMPNTFNRCYESWLKFCPDYNIQLWNEENFPLDLNEYVKKSYQNKKYAFLSDYVRLYVIYHYGGIYLDIDVELIKNPDFLLDHDGFMGFMEKKIINTGLGFGSRKGHPIIEYLLDEYEKLATSKDFKFEKNTFKDSFFLQNYGLILNNSYQIIDGFHFLPIEYMCPTYFDSARNKFTKNTISIHHYEVSWNPSHKIYQNRMKNLKSSYISKSGNFIGSMLFKTHVYFIRLNKNLKKNGLHKTIKKILTKLID